MATKPKLGIPVNQLALTLTDENPDDYIGTRYVQSVASQDSGVPEPEPSSKFRRVVGDGLITGLKGAIGVPEAVVGLADIATGGHVGKALENEGGSFGFRPDQAKSYLDQFYTPEQLAAFAAVQNAANPDDSLGQRILDTGAAAIRNPSTIVHAVGESLPAMGAGGVLGRGAMMAAPKMSSFAAAGIGEGVISAGSTAAQIRQGTEDGLLTGQQAALSAGSGALTMGLGVVAGKAAKSMGIGDIDTMIVGGKHVDAQVQKGFVRRVLEGAFTEGVLEELPQSVQEQVAQNYALGKPLDEGVDQAAVMGLLSGGAMGVGAQAISRPKVPEVGALSRAANIAVAGIATPAAAAATDAPAVTAPTVDLTPEQSQELLDHANARMQELTAKAKGSKGEDGAEVAPQFLTPQEKGEQEFLQAAGGDVQALARAYQPEASPIEGTPEDAAPAAPPASAADLPKPSKEAFDQREKDRPAEPIGKVQDGDILNRVGAPFTNMAAAMSAKKRAGDNHEIVRVAKGLVIRPKAGASLDAAETPDVAPVTSDASGDQPGGSVGNGADQPTAPGTHDGDNAAPLDGRSQSAEPVADGRGGADAVTAPAESGNVATLDDAAHGASTSPTNDLPEPTDAQKKAGNYQKGHVNVGGLDMSIENPAGSTRSGTDRDGKAWENTLQHHYGYIKGTMGNDKDHVDAFVKPGTALDHAAPVFVVDQVHPDTKKFDEHKVLIGFDSIEEAKTAYRANYAKGWQGMQAISTMPWTEFKAWVKDGPKNSPLVPITSKPATAAAAPAPQSESGERWTRMTTAERDAAVVKAGWTHPDEPRPSLIGKRFVSKAWGDLPVTAQDKLAKTLEAKAETKPAAAPNTAKPTEVAPAEKESASDPHIELRKRISVLKSLLECMA